ATSRRPAAPAGRRYDLLDDSKTARRRVAGIAAPCSAFAAARSWTARKSTAISTGLEAKVCRSRCEVRDLGRTAGVGVPADAGRMVGPELTASASSVNAAALAQSATPSRKWIQ